MVTLLCSLPWTVEDLELLLLLSNYGLRILLFLEGPAAVHELDTSSGNDCEVLRVVRNRWSRCGCLLASGVFKPDIHVSERDSLRVQWLVATLRPESFDRVRAETSALGLLRLVLDVLLLLFISGACLRIVNSVGCNPGIQLLTIFVNRRCILGVECDETHVERVRLLYSAGDSVLHLSENFRVMGPCR